jgi:hypothetical protein
MSVSDFKINTKVRAVLVKHWIDTQALKFGSFRGTVRLTGELFVLGDRISKNFDGAKLEAIESEVRRIPGVSRVYLDLGNWKKNEIGKWSPAEKAKSRMFDDEEDRKTFVMNDPDR